MEENVMKNTNEGTKDNQNEITEKMNIQTSHKKPSRKLVVGSAICVACIVDAFYYFKIYDGGFPVTQAVDTYELGSEQDILDSLKYDERKIIDVSIVDRGGFSIDKTGSYTVTFDFINSRKNHKQIPYTYKVEDTIAPELTVKQNEIYIAKGHDFNIDDYASSTDTSQTDTIKYDENFDVNTVGNYELNLYAEDDSDNKSETQPVKVIVEDRDNCDVNLANFGETREIVKRYETHDIIEEGEAGIAYSCDDTGLPGYMYYWFTADDKFSGLMYEYETTYEWDSFLNQYPIFKQDIVEKYGEPATSNEMYDTSLGKSTSLWLGRYIQRDTWDLDNMEITTQLYNDNSTVKLVIFYNSKEYGND